MWFSMAPFPYLSFRVAGVGWLSGTAAESLRAFGERVFANFCDKNVVFYNCGKTGHLWLMTYTHTGMFPQTPILMFKKKKKIYFSQVFTILLVKSFVQNTRQRLRWGRMIITDRLPATPGSSCCFSSFLALLDVIFDSKCNITRGEMPFTAKNCSHYS